MNAIPLPSAPRQDQPVTLTRQVPHWHYAKWERRRHDREVALTQAVQFWNDDDEAATDDDVIGTADKFYEWLTEWNDKHVNPNRVEDEDQP